MSAQLLQVKFNGAHNAYGGERNQYVLSKVDNDIDLPKEIDQQLNLCDYILVNYKGKLYYCERRLGGGYTRREIFYHPFQDKFLDNSAGYSIFIPDEIQAIQSDNICRALQITHKNLALVSYRPDCLPVSLKMG